ncbi:hypothetical protein FRB95_010401 [Tulasnella sp. JGI-2019a]|nr:hypothetical protein FRB95_010401 [Tulasnella sp. JGI-2019a]
MIMTNLRSPMAGLLATSWNFITQRRTAVFPMAVTGARITTSLRPIDLALAIGTGTRGTTPVFPSIPMHPPLRHVVDPTLNGTMAINAARSPRVAVAAITTTTTIQATVVIVITMIITEMVPVIMLDLSPHPYTRLRLAAPITSSTQPRHAVSLTGVLLTHPHPLKIAIAHPIDGGTTLTTAVFPVVQTHLSLPVAPLPRVRFGTRSIIAASHLRSHRRDRVAFGARVIMEIMIGTATP